jgi:hypothetical protein
MTGPLRDDLGLMLFFGGALLVVAVLTADLYAELPALTPMLVFAVSAVGATVACLGLLKHLCHEIGFELTYTGPLTVWFR